MWISKRAYEEKQQYIKQLEMKSDFLDRLGECISQIKSGDINRFYLSEAFCLMSTKVFEELSGQITKLKDEVMDLTAQRDWYKNAYAAERAAKNAEIS